MLKMQGLLLALAAFCWSGAIAAVDLTGCAPNPPKVINTLYQPEGDIYSPGYNTKYPNDLYCQYNIKAPLGYRIKLNFVSMDIEPYDLCMKDMVSVHEGDNEWAPVHAIVCGNQTQNPILSGGNSLTMMFKSDFLVGKPGFHVHYIAAMGHAMCPGGKTPCKNGNCYLISEKCNGLDECGDGTDEENCGKQAIAVECGVPAITPKPVSHSVSQDRIIGGQEVTPGSWPWQADLQLSYYYPCGHMCGGTLISPQWVLSAAHCFQGNPNPLEWRIHLGNHHKFKKDAHEQIRYPERIIVYPGFTGQQLRGQVDMQNDVSLVKLNAPVKITDHVRPACLPSQGYEVPTGTVCMATGWGMTRGSGNSRVLKQVDLSVRNPTECLNDMMQFVNKTMICVANDKGYQDVCHGDSGGPLVQKSGPKYTVVGATSFGTYSNYEGGLCAMKDARTVYAKVSDKISWILRQMSMYS